MLESEVTRKALRGQHCCPRPQRYGPWVMTELSEREAGSFTGVSRSVLGQ
jgi:hypothetical protein